MTGIDEHWEEFIGFEVDMIVTQPLVHFCVILQFKLVAVQIREDKSRGPCLRPESGSGLGWLLPPEIPSSCFRLSPLRLTLHVSIILASPSPSQPLSLIFVTPHHHFSHARI